MILNISAIKTEALLLFCRDLIQTYSNSNQKIYSIDEDIVKYIDTKISELAEVLNKIVQPIEYYIQNSNVIRIKYIIKSYKYINNSLEKLMKKNQPFNPAMLCIALLTTWFKELHHQNNSKEFLYFSLYPYSEIYDKLLLDIKSQEFKLLNIAMIDIAESIIIKYNRYNINN
jgi:hypothetical protein